MIGEVTLTGSNGTVTTITEPDEFNFLGADCFFFDLMIGAENLVADSYIATAKQVNGGKVIWSSGDPNNGTDVETEELVITPKKGMDLVPICKIKRLAIMKNGDLKVKFTAPYAENSVQIRIRVYNEDITGFVEQFKYNPPYQIEKKDGTIIPDKMKVFIPGEYAGRIARLEYWMTEDGEWDTYISRGLTLFKLPELEVE